MISPDGRFGGPARVAVDLADGLSKRGHSVTIASVGEGFDGRTPASGSSLNYKLFSGSYILPRTAGYAGLASYRLWRWALTATPGFDIIHIHLARDFVTLISAAIAIGRRRKVYLQTHGMIDRSDRWLAKPLDALLTRPILRKASVVLCLNEKERDEILTIEPLSQTQIIPNGIDAYSEEAWSAENGVEVLFLARLHERKQPMAFIEMARALSDAWPDAVFTLIGPDEGEGPRVRQALAEANNPRIKWSGAISPEDVATRMASCSIYVLPALNEPFGMTVLEAMAAGRPVVISETCGLAPEVTRNNAGLTVGAEIESLIQAVNSLLADPETRRTMGLRGRNLVKKRFALDSIIEAVEGLYVRKDRR